MISHKYKIIFIHVPKCAGSTVETAFGLDVNNNQKNSEYLFGWDEVNKIYLQHATPQQLIDCNLISQEQWNSYYKFIIVRNSWDKVISDFFWFKDTKNFSGSFEDYLYSKKSFSRFTNINEKSYRGDHLTPQIDYMFLNGRKIDYDRIVYFDKINLKSDLKLIATDIGLNSNFFERKVQIGKSFKKHYSMYYSPKRAEMVNKKYENDIKFFNFSFDDKKNWSDTIKARLIELL